jgi:hypothetical protein
VSPWVITRKGERIWSGPQPGTPGQIYILCFGEPRQLKSVDFSLPRFKGVEIEPPRLVSHYVGITWRLDPRERLYEHGRGVVNALVEWRQGDEEEERRIKTEEMCPRCGRSLDYRAEVAAQRAAARRQRRRTSDREAVRRAAFRRAAQVRADEQRRQIRRTSSRGRVRLELRRRANFRRIMAERARPPE